MKQYLFISGFLFLLNATLIFSVGLNLSFESNSCSLTECQYLGPNGGIPDWYVESGEVDLVNDTTFDAYQGTWSIDLNGNGIISQDFSVTVGSTYTMTFYLSGNPLGEQGVKIVQVNVTGNTPQNFTVDTTSLTANAMGYTLKSYVFSAGTSVVSLSFKSMSTGTTFGPVVDLVTVTLDPSPSVTPSISVSPSVSPSRTPSVSPSRTPSISPSVTPSISPSVSPSISISPSRTPSVSPSRTPSISVSPSLGSSPSSTPSVTPSISVSSSTTPSNTPTPTTTPSTTASATPSVTPSGTVSPSSFPSWTPYPSFSYSSSSTPTPTASAVSSNNTTSNGNPGDDNSTSRTENATIAAAILVPIGSMFIALIAVVLKHGPCGACGRFIINKIGADNDVEMQ